MLQEVVPMLKQQLEKSMLDRNYVQLERVRGRPTRRYNVAGYNQSGQNIHILQDVLTM